MKRWQTKNEKLMIGGLFLLLVVGSFHLNDWSDLEHGAAFLSATSAPDIKKDITLNKRKLKATYRRDEADASRTKVTVSPMVSTEGTVCAECNTYIVERPMNDGNEANLKAIELELVKMIEADKSSKIGTDNDLKTKEETEEELSDLDRGIAAIAKACGKKKSDSYSHCALSQIAKLAKLKGDKSFNSETLVELFNESSIKGDLQDQLKDKEDKYRQNKALSEITKLFNGLDRGNGGKLRSELALMKQIPLELEKKEIAELDRKIKLAERTDRQLAMVLKQEMLLKRSEFADHIQEALLEADTDYRSMIDGESLSANDAYLDYYKNYYGPLNRMREAAFSDNPSAGNSTRYGIQNFNNAARMARNQGGVNPQGFPQGNQWNTQNNNFDQRSFPQNGNNFNSRFARPTQQPGYQQGGYQQPIGQNYGYRGNNGSTWFSPSNSGGNQPNSYYNPTYPMANYNQQDVFNRGANFGYSQPFRGTNGPLVATPLSNGVNFNGGYPYNNGVYGYRPNTAGNPNQYGYAAPYGYQGAGVPNGPMGGSSARPRF